MAGGEERILRRRIRSIQSTKKITRAMELIASSRIARAQQRVNAAHPYAEQITGVIRNLAAAGARFESKLLQPVLPVEKIAFVVVTADRGLAGAYNSNVIRAAEREVRAEQAAGRSVSIVAVGRKARNYFGYRRYTIDESFTGFSETPTYNDAKAVADYVLERFEAEDYHQVRLAYTRFLSVGRQQAVVAPYMPLELEGIDRATDEMPADYEYEPDPTEILERLLPRYAEARLFAALLESAASFYAAQQRAMKAATDNAEDLITKLTRAMNRARQDAITTEIMEIVGGAEALRQAGAGTEEVAPALALQDLLPDEQRLEALSTGS